MNFTEIFSVLSNMSVPIAAIITSICALKGINSWRNQLIGKNKYEISVKLLNKTIRLRKKIFNTRKRTVKTYETEENEESIGNENSTKVSIGLRRRMTELLYIYSQFEYLLIEAEVFLGSVFIEQTESISKLVDDLIFSINEFIYNEEDNWSVLKYDKDYRKKLDKKIFQNDDAFDEEIGTIFKKIEVEIRRNM